MTTTQTLSTTLTTFLDDFTVAGGTITETETDGLVRFLDLKGPKGYKSVTVRMWIAPTGRVVSIHRTDVDLANVTELTIRGTRNLYRIPVR